MITWKEAGTPVSNIFDDIYFSNSNGLEETEHVFIHANKIVERFHLSKEFSILELGFGTGLNFTTTLKHWINNYNQTKTLNYFSVEKFPLLLGEIVKIQNLFPIMQKYYSLWEKGYSSIHKGFNLIPIFDYNVNLVLLNGECLEQLKQIEGSFDVFFLDGFSPNKNPDMWTSEIFSELFRLSKLGTTASTFSSARIVKQGFTENGFTIKKVKGFQNKREMLTAVVESIQKKNEYLLSDKPYFQQIGYSNSTVHSIGILGAGLSGCSLAFQFSKENFEVTIVDENSEEASEASGIGSVISHPSISKEPTPKSLLSIRAFYYSIQFLEKYFPDLIQKRGVFHLFTELHEKFKIEKGIETHGLLETHIKIDDLKNYEELLNREGFYFPEGFIIDSKKLCKAYLRSSEKLNKIFNQKIYHIIHEDNKWILSDERNNVILKCDLLVLANSFNTNQFIQTSYIHLNKIRGQVNYLKSNQKSKNIKTVLMHKNYFLPADNGYHVIGGTFDEFNHNLGLNSDDSTSLLNNLNSKFPELQFSNSDVHGGKVGIRTQSSDRLPLIGKIPHKDFYFSEYSDYQKKLYRKIPVKKAEYLPNLYTVTGLGSKGLIYSIYASQLIKNLIFNHPLPIEKNLSHTIHVGRELIRKLKRG